ncbi:mercury methylation corrinoid protein HgcA [Desulfospira joergensenii]|uniref:mercury methylation corrinoid protein HgcA n=1 Tax=Desulfospira joergensenii TaxID=53329 RepID=UPI0012946521
MPSQENSDLSCCGSGVREPALPGDQKPGYALCSHVEDFLPTHAGRVPIIKTRLNREDLFSTFYVRCGIGRDDYRVAPGLYAVGKPDRESEVLVTANFKLTFDHVRKNLKEVDAWILVLDTWGVNVWCAAGKGTFSTGELVSRIETSCLDKVVDHRRVIVPQLGATGVSARAVKKASGFRVVYGPIRARDIPRFLENRRKADPAMRRVTFPLYERFILTPVEIKIALKPALITAIVLILLSGIGPGVFSFSGAWERGMAAIAALVTGILAGGFVTPVLLPYLPFRAFAPKGIIIGSAASVLLLLMSTHETDSLSRILALFLFSTAVSSYLAMNFTGATPFTSPSGVEKEMKQFIPVQAGALAISLGLWIYSAF